MEAKKLGTIEEFFRDALNQDWKPLPQHKIYQSPSSVCSASNVILLVCLTLLIIMLSASQGELNL
jgi:hypothetical protein